MMPRMLQPETIMTQAISSTIRLLNKNYTIKCPEDEIDNLAQAADKLNQHLLLKRTQFYNLDDYNVLLLAALQVSHELIVDRINHAEQNQQLSQLVSLLESKINNDY